MDPRASTSSSATPTPTRGAPGEAELRALLDETTELVCTTGPDGRIDYVNRAWRHSLGYTLEEASTLHPTDFVAPEQRGFYRDVARRLVVGEPVEDFEAVLLAKDGHRVVCRGRAMPVIEGGRCVATRAVYRDVTAERQSGMLRARLAATLEATSDLVAIFTRDGEIVYLNRAGRRLMGLAENADLTGIRAEDFHPPHALDRLFGEALPAAIERGSWEGESTLLAAHAEEVPVSIVIVAHPSVRRGEAPFFLSIVMRDLRERVRAEQARREGEQRFRAVLENLRAIAITLDPAGRVTFVNDYFLAISGWTRDEVIGTDWFARVVPDGEAVRRLYEEGMIAGTFPTHFENSIVTRDGEALLIAWDNVLLRDAAGRASGAASVGRDVTDERRVRELQNQLIATTSHEVRNPLGAVLAALRLLARVPDLPAGRPREILDVALRNTERVIRLTNDLLDVERTESGAALLNRVAVAADDLITMTTETLRHAADAAGVSLVHVRDGTSAALTAWADVDRITQVLTNLVGNAVKFSPRGSTVAVGAEAGQGGEVLFIVRDRGRGIPTEQLETIFERFAQVRAEDGFAHRGAGLGLAIARAIVRQHGGRIWAESAAEKGSAFYFALPGKAED